jgi:hypothetical protein
MSTVDNIFADRVRADRVATVTILEVARVSLSHRMKPGARERSGERWLRRNLSRAGEGAHARP